MPIKKGDFVILNYTCKVRESGETIDTTVKKVAEEAKIAKEGKAAETYEPLFVVVGEGWVPKGLDEALVGLETGKTAAIEVPPEKGYGLRDPSKMRLLPLRKFRAEGVEPLPGMQVQVDGKLASVRSAGAGRVQVDFNHPLAGKTLTYDLSIEKILESKEDKIRALIHKQIPTVSMDKFNLKVQDNELTVEEPEEAFYIEGVQLAKKEITSNIEKFMPDLEKISFIEIFRKLKPASQVEPEQAVAQKDT